MREALDEIVEPIIYAEALELIEHHRRQGDRLPGVGLTRGDRPPAGRDARRRRCDRHRGARSTTTGATPARWPSTPTGPPRPTPCGSWPRSGHRPGAAPTPTRTPPPISRCSRLVGHPVAVNPDRALARSPGERGGRSGVHQAGSAARPREPYHARRQRHAGARRCGGAPRRGRRSRLATRTSGHPSACGHRRPPDADRRSETRSAGALTPAGDREPDRGSGSGGAEPLGGHDTDGDEEGDEEELLHALMLLGCAAGAHWGARLGRLGVCRTGPVRRSSRSRAPVSATGGAASTSPAPRSGGSAPG